MAALEPEWVGIRRHYVPFSRLLRDLGPDVTAAGMALVAEPGGITLDWMGSASATSPREPAADAVATAYVARLVRFLAGTGWRLLSTVGDSKGCPVPRALRCSLKTFLTARPHTFQLRWTAGAAPSGSADWVVRLAPEHNEAPVPPMRISPAATLSPNPWSSGCTGGRDAAAPQPVATKPPMMPAHLPPPSPLLRLMDPAPLPATRSPMPLHSALEVNEWEASLTAAAAAAPPSGNGSAGDAKPPSLLAAGISFLDASRSSDGSPLCWYSHTGMEGRPSDMDGITTPAPAEHSGPSRLSNGSPLPAPRGPGGAPSAAAAAEQPEGLDETWWAEGEAMLQKLLLE